MINSNYKSISKIIAVLALIVAISSCKKDLEGLEPATYPSIGDVFIDGFSSGLDYASYSPADGADVTAFEVVSDIVYDGDAAMRFAIPDPGNPNGSFAGGSFFVEGGRDLSGFNALTFWMKGSKNALIDLIGFGDELAFGDSKFKASISNVPVNSNWQQYIIPLPDPSVLTMEKGMFWYADGSGNDDDLGYTFWIDEVKFENLGTIAQYRPAIFYGENEEVEAETGQNITIGGLTQTVNTSIGDVTVHASSSYFTFSSSNTSVATVSNEGVAMV
ncbi:MAG: hypothetical protein GY751_16050, partial [Bacteroidetes bacterium]|nr:hypothetical protein [Bacteroidota bacterium]